MSGEGAVLAGVDAEQVEPGEHVAGDRPGRRGVEDREPGGRHRRRDGLVGHLEHGEHDVGVEGGGVDGQGRVGAGVDDDRGLAVVVDLDHRGARGGVPDAPDGAEVDPTGAQERQRLPGERVGADGGEQPHAGAEPGRGEGLVGALPAGDAGDAARAEGLPGCRQLLDAGDQVEVDAADHGDGRAGSGGRHARDRRVTPVRSDPRQPRLLTVGVAAVDRAPPRVDAVLPGAVLADAQGAGPPAAHRAARAWCSWARACGSRPARGSGVWRSAGSCTSATTPACAATRAPCASGTRRCSATRTRSTATSTSSSARPRCSPTGSTSATSTTATPTCTCRSRTRASSSRRCASGRRRWIGTKVTVLRGARVGRGCVLGAHAVVRGDVPDYSVAVGAPARVVRDRHGRLRGRGRRPRRARGHRAQDGSGRGAGGGLPGRARRGRRRGSRLTARERSFATYGPEHRSRAEDVARRDLGAAEGARGTGARRRRRGRRSRRRWRPGEVGVEARAGGAGAARGRPRGSSRQRDDRRREPRHVAGREGQARDAVDAPPRPSPPARDATSGAPAAAASSAVIPNGS